MQLQSLTFHALGTQVCLAILPSSADDPDSLLQSLQAGRVMIARLEKLLSRFDPDSELSSINHRPGDWIAVGPELAQILHLSEQAMAWTDGLFHPGLGRVMEAIGYSRPYDQIKQLEGEIVNRPFALIIEDQTCTTRLPDCPFDWSDDRSTVRLLPGYQLDLGGIAKGWIVEQVADYFDHCGYTNFVCDAGGDMVCRGQNGEQPWEIGIEDPFHLGQDVYTLDVQSLAVATSGTYRRQWMKDGVRMHHLINPRSGRPAASDLIACTVIHPKLVTAELMAKTCLLMGSKPGSAWLAAKGATGWVAVTQSGELLDSWQT